LALKPYGIAARLVDAVALTAAFGQATKIGIGEVNAGDCDILAPAGFVLSAAEAKAACAIPASQYVFTFGNTESADLAATIGPVIELLASASGTGFVAACLATPWTGRCVYQGHLFQQGNLHSDLKRELAPHIHGRIGVLPHERIAAGSAAIRAQLTGMKEQGVRLALLDAIDEEQCGVVAEALARLPVIAGPAWISPGTDAPETGASVSGSVAILSGALHRQSLMQTAAARVAMAVLDLDLSAPPGTAAANALTWARPHFGTPFLITSSAPPGKIRTGVPAAEMLAATAEALAGAGIRNFVLSGNHTAAVILQRLGITQLVAGAAFAGLRWLKGGDFNILIKPGGYGTKNLFLYDFEPQSRLNAPAE
jgi:3-dehydrotetronate 4-kinase